MAVVRVEGGTDGAQRMSQEKNVLLVARKMRGWSPDIQSFHFGNEAACLCGRVCVLYEMLRGRPNFDTKGWRTATWDFATHAAGWRIMWEMDIHGHPRRQQHHPRGSAPTSKERRTAAAGDAEARGVVGNASTTLTKHRHRQHTTALRAKRTFKSRNFKLHHFKPKTTA